MNAAAARDDHEDDHEDGREDGRERRRPGPRPLRRTSPPATDSVWIARLAHYVPSGNDEHSLVLVNSDRFPAGTPVDCSDQDCRGRRPTGWLVDVRYRACDGHVLRIEVSDAVATPGPPLWFAEIAHATSEVPSVSLVAFAGGAHPAGALVGPHDVARRGLRMSDRVGEIRWGIRSGVVETVSVEPVFRRQGIGRVLATAAEGLRLVRGWAPLTTDGRLTDSGAVWLEGAPSYWRARLTERSAHLPPGDEPEGPTGVARLLR
jgi:GNAT superfamily N-acetyltransferase